VTLRERLLRCHWLLSAQFGLDLLKLVRSLRAVPRYVAALARFRAAYRGKLELVPCLHDWSEEGGAAKDEYFWQDLLVARKVFAARPERHVDVGSRVDGFVAHVASFREIEVFDVRPNSAQVPGVRFHQADFTQALQSMDGYCDSLSCLHALEHFGLGRYGDPIDPDGWKRGLANMARLLRTGGMLYLSLPIGMERVEFNAQAVHDPRTVIRVAAQHGLALTALTAIRPNAAPEELRADEAELSRVAGERYALGLFVFKKS
jgi:SAM-dependent methyltransferase